MILYKYYYTCRCEQENIQDSLRDTQLVCDGYFESKAVFDALMERWSIRGVRYFESEEDSKKNKKAEMIMFDNDYFIANRSMVSRYGEENDRMCFIEGQQTIQFPSPL